MTRHTQRPGFPCIAAVLGGEIIGFIYGIGDGLGTGQGIPGARPSSGSHDILAQRIAVGHMPQHWAEAYHIAEVHVRPSWQGKTIGTNLVRKLCASLTGGKVVLTVVANPGARRLYQRLGFCDLPPAGPEVPIVVMGANLPLPSD